jgi:hypothetical protein
VNLEKLRKASLHELRVRAAQRVAAFNERRGWSSLVRLPSDDGFASLLTLERTTATSGLLEYFRSRRGPRFFAGLENPQTTTAEFKSRFPSLARELIDKANRIGEGKFDLLGYKNLSFGDPIDWQFEPLTGKRIPRLHWSKLDFLDAEVAGDKKIIWELNRHQYFVTLGQAYWLTGDEHYARIFAAHLAAWMDANPPKSGINWASSLEIAFRSMAWVWAFYFFKSSPSVPGETFKRAWKFLYLSARHLESYLSTYFSPNTHLTGEALGLFFLGTLLPEFRAANRWRDLGAEILIEQLPLHVHRDGVYFEQSSYYHRYTTDFYLQFLLLARSNKYSLPAQVEQDLVLLLDHLMYITRPDGTTPLFGDDDGGRLTMLDVRPANDFRGTLAVGAVMMDRDDYRFVAADAVEQVLWLTGVEGLNNFETITPKQPEKTSIAFCDGGYFVMRDGWRRDSNFLLFDCGPHGSLAYGHAHADALSIDVSANGRTVLVDPGTYTYTGSKELRDWFRSSHAHNTVTIDGQSSSAPKGPFSWESIARCSLEKWVTEARFDFVSARHDGFTRLPDPVIVKREILFLKSDYWIVRDTVAATGEHEVDVRFNFDSGVPIESGIEIHCFGSDARVEEKTLVSHCYGQKEPARGLRFTATLKGGGDLVTFVLPQKGGIEWAVKEIEANDGRAFEVSGANSVDVVMVPASGAWVWTRSVDGHVREKVST